MLLIRRFAMVVSILVLTSGCIGMVVGQTTSAAVAVAKVPFKVGGAVVDVATGDDEDDDNDKKKDKDEE